MCLTKVASVFEQLFHLQYQALSVDVYKKKQHCVVLHNHTCLKGWWNLLMLWSLIINDVRIVPLTVSSVHWKKKKTTHAHRQ